MTDDLRSRAEQWLAQSASRTFRTTAEDHASSLIGDLLEVLSRQSTELKALKAQELARVVEDKPSLPRSGSTAPTHETKGAHRWVRNDPRWTSLRDLTFCEVCGVCQRADGKNRPCSGVTPRITWREQPADATPHWENDRSERTLEAGRTPAAVDPQGGVPKADARPRAGEVLSSLTVGDVEPR